MLRLIMQYEEEKLPTAKEPALPSNRYNGGYNNGSSGLQTPPAASPSVSALNLNFKVFDITCPELEKVLRKSLVDGSNEKKLVLLGIEIVNDPPKPQAGAPNWPPAQPPALTPPADPKAIAAQTKAALAAKHNGSRTWRSRLFGRSTPKPLPLPG